MNYYDYQLSNALRSFGDEVFGLKITVLPRTTFVVSNGTNIVAYNLARLRLLMTRKTAKLVTEPVASDNTI